MLRQLGPRRQRIRTPHDPVDEVVISCVNRVGVDVNTASASLLRYVAGLGAKLAKAALHGGAVV